MKVNDKPNDYNGPFAYHKQIKDYVKKNGSLLSEHTPSDPKNPDWGIDVFLVHIPSSKVATTNTYINAQGVMTIFNGFFQEPLDNPASEFKWLPGTNRGTRRAMKTGKFTDKEL